MKRLLYLLIIIVAIALVVLIGYLLRYRAETPPLGTETPGGLPSPQTTTGQQPPSAGQQPSGQQTTGAGTAAGYQPRKFGVVAQNQVVSYYVDDQNNVILVQPDGQIIKITRSEAVALSSSAIVNLIRASFSYDGKKILATFGDVLNPQSSVFDVASKSWTPLQQNLKSPVWSPNNYQIAYFVDKVVDRNTASSLATLDISNSKSKPEELISIRAQDLSLDWLNPTQILISDKSSALSMGSLLGFDIKKKVFSIIVEEKVGLDSIWSGATNTGLVFSANINSRGGDLTLYNARGDLLRQFTILTLPSKCAFDIRVASSTPATTIKATSTTPSSSSPTSAKSTLYCAVPRDLQKFSTSRLPDEYEKEELFTTDDLYKINLENGDIEVIFNDISQNLDASLLKVFNQTLFFVNRFDQKLYALSL